MKKSIFTVLLGVSLIALISGCSQKEEEIVRKSTPGAWICLSYGAVMMMMGFLDHMLKSMVHLNIQHLVMLKKDYKN